MRREIFSAAALAIAGFFLFADRIICANEDIVINEIGACEAGDHEWIEIWNKGSEPIDLSGWKFWESDTNHGMQASTTDSIVEAGEYAAICQDEEYFLADHPGFGGSIFDSSWGSLNESGEEIGLKDVGGNFIEQFNYISAPTYSLERKNPFIAIYDETNWAEHLSGNTMGLINSVFSTSTVSEPPTSTPTSTPEAVTSTLWATIKINEFVSDPTSGNEWVELYNPSTSSLFMEGGVICDSRETGCKSVAGTVSATGWLYVDLLTASFLNNDGDSVILKNPEGAIVDRIDYSSVLSPDKGQSFARRVDGADTDSDGDWSITTSITPESANVITAPVIPSSGGGSSPKIIPAEEIIVPTSTPATTTINNQGQLVINEVYPDPAGSDMNDEFVEIRNLSGVAVDLAGWKAGDLVKNYSLSGTVPAYGYSYWMRSVTGIALNNSSREEIKLTSPQGSVVDVISYERAVQEQSYSRTASGTFLWTTTPSPGVENEFNILGTGIAWKISAPSTGEVGEMIVFNADDSADERGGSLSFVWDFGDNSSSTGGEVGHMFSVSGTYPVVVFASSTSGSSGQKKVDVVIGQGLTLSDIGVVICEIMPNPVGSDQREFIELCNNFDKAINLAGWGLKVKNKIFVFPDNTVLGAGMHLVFYRTATALVLDNNGGRVELIDRDGALADLVKYGKGGEGASYSLGDEWTWTDLPTPGLPNILTEDGTRTTEDVKSGTPKAGAVAFESMSIQEARQADIGTGVRIRGAVAVLPSIFGSQFFYLCDSTNGIQIYQYKKDFPKLAVGEWIEVEGIISDASGVRRVKLKNHSSVRVIKKSQTLMPLTAEIGSIGEENLGALVRVKGEVTEIKSNYMYIDNREGEIKIFFKKGAKIDKSVFKEGENVEIVGTLEQWTNEFQIWPRTQADIISLGLSTELAAKEIVAAQDNSKELASKYLTATAGGLTALLLGFVGRAKGYLLKGMVRKAAVFAINLFKRG